MEEVTKMYGSHRLQAINNNVHQMFVPVSSLLLLLIYCVTTRRESSADGLSSSLVSGRIF